MSMRPIRESREADDRYGPFVWGDRDLVEKFVGLSTSVRQIVPTCVGMSLSLLEEGVTITLVASGEDVALLDAVQYVDGGPCLDSLSDSRDVISELRLTVRDDCRLFSSVTASRGIQSTLSLPVAAVVRGGESSPVAGFNLYASTSFAFQHHRDELAALLGAWAPGAVADVDLDFRTRDVARLAPAILAESTNLAVAAGMLAADRQISQADAEDRLRKASVRAAVPLSSLIEALLPVLRR